MTSYMVKLIHVLSLIKNFWYNNHLKPFLLPAVVYQTIDVYVIYTHIYVSFLLHKLILCKLAHCTFYVFSGVVMNS